MKYFLVPIFLFIVSPLSARQQRNLGVFASINNSMGGGGGPAPGSLILGMDISSTPVDSTLYNPTQMTGLPSGRGYIALYTAIPLTAEIYAATALGANGQAAVYTSTGGLLCFSASQVISGPLAWNSFALNGCPTITAGQSYSVLLVGDNYYYLGADAGLGVSYQIPVIIDSLPNPWAVNGGGSGGGPSGVRLKN